MKITPFKISEEERAFLQTVGLGSYTQGLREIINFYRKEKGMVKKYIYRGEIETSEFNVYCEADYREDLDGCLHLIDYNITQVNGIDAKNINPLAIEAVNDEIVEFLNSPPEVEEVTYDH